MTAEIHAWELKGPGDLAAIESIAHAYGSGQDDETIWACLEDLRAIRAELRERLLLELTTKEDASGGPSSRSRWATVALGGGGGGAVRCAAAPGRPLTGYGAAGACSPTDSSCSPREPRGVHGDAPATV